MVRTARAIDLFCGAGGATLGLRQAGFDVLFGADLSPDARASFEANQRVKCLGADLRLLKGVDLLEIGKLRRGECDLLMGCPPCQGFSTHRLRNTGCGDARNDLISVYASLICEVEPKYFIFENVPGLLRDSVFWKPALKKIRSLGYVLSIDVLNAADFGVPQHRRRLTVIGARHDAKPVSHPRPTHFAPEAGASTSWATVRGAIGHLPIVRSGESDQTDPLHTAPTHRLEILRRISKIPSDGGSRMALPPEEVLNCHMQHNGHKAVYGRLRWSKPANTITSGCTQPSRGRFLHPELHRGLTLREAALLQGFPPDYKFSGTKQEIALQIGNALPPPFARALAEQILLRR